MPGGVELVEVEQRQRRRGGLREFAPRAQRPARALCMPWTVAPAHTSCVKGESIVRRGWMLVHVTPASLEARRESVVLREDGAQVRAGRHEPAGCLARESRGQRADDAVERGLVDVPLVGAVLADRLRGVQRRDVGGRRGRELRRQLRDHALRAQPREQRRALGEALEERPAERVHEHGDDPRRRLAELGQHVGRQALAPARRRARGACRECARSRSESYSGRTSPPGRRAASTVASERSLITRGTRRRGPAARRPRPSRRRRGRS